jgi:Ca2+/Na+ antiporter
MLYVLLFTLISGTIASLLFFLIYKRHLKQNGTIQEKSFVMNAPKIFGSINILLGIILGIYFIINPSAFSSDVAMPSNKIILLLSHIFFSYFYFFALPLSIKNWLKWLEFA